VEFFGESCWNTIQSNSFAPPISLHYKRWRHSNVVLPKSTSNCRSGRMTTFLTRPSAINYSWANTSVVLSSLIVNRVPSIWAGMDCFLLLLLSDNS